MNELEIIQHRQIDGLSMFLNTVDDRTLHSHAEWELIWILDQPISVFCGRERFTAEAGQLVLFCPNELHGFQKLQAGCTFLCLQISCEALPVSRHLVVDGHLPHLHLPHSELQWIREQLLLLMQRYLLQEELYAVFCRGLSSLIFHRLLSQLPTRVLTTGEAADLERKNGLLQRLLRFVDENHTRKIRLSDFARTEGYSTTYLSRFIKNAMNQTFQDYVSSIRFRHACALMETRTMRMLDICLESGFSDYRYFSRAFRDRCGMTPEEFSRRMTERPPMEDHARRSLSSVERFYSHKESLQLLEKLTQ